MAQPLNILIVGASIAGPAFASFLCRSSLKANVTILERAPSVRREGQNIDLRGVGLQAAQMLGLEQSIRAHLTGEKGVSWIDDADRAVASIAANKPGEAAGPTADIEMLRGTLAGLVVQRCEQLGRESSSVSLDFVFNDYIADMQQHGDSVEVTFANSNTRRSFDIVVGADGLQSRTRRQAFGQEGEGWRLNKLDIYAGFFSMSRGGSDSDWRRWYHAPLARGVMLRPSDRPDRTTVFMHVKTEDQRFTDVAVGARDVAAQKALLQETFADIAWSQKDRILQELEDSKDFYYDMIAQVKMDRWSKGRVVLLGDAAHCATPVSGMGTSLALTGAYHLAGALAQHPDDVTAAFAAYEEAQRPLVAKAQKLSPALPLLFGTVTPWQVWLANQFGAFVAMLGPFLKPLFRLFAPGNTKESLRVYDGLDLPHLVQ